MAGQGANIDNLTINVNSSAKNAVNSLNSLVGALNRLNGITSSASQNLTALDSGITQVTQKFVTLNNNSKNAINNIQNLWKNAQNAGNAAKKGASGLSRFWSMLKRIAMMRAIRAVIRGITQSIGDGIKNLYHWSDAINGHFAASMDRLATSTQYLKNSFAAMVSPLIESLIPILDTVIDKIVEGLNYVNMFFSAISGSDTYTVAKKAAAVWDDSAEKTKKSAKSVSAELKRTILGFDEINKLTKNTGSSSGTSNASSKTPDYSSMFEEKPLTGFFKKIADASKDWPDWLKWLLGIGGVALAGWGLSQLPRLLSGIFDWLKKLFTVKVPNWFKWLFDPNSNRDIDLNLPKDFQLPDAEIKTNLTKGDWSELDELNGKTVYLSPKLNNKAQVLYNNFKRDWDESGSKSLYFTPKLSNKAQVLYDNFKREWDAVGSKSLYFAPKLNNQAKVLYNNFKKEWDESGSKTLYFSPKMDNKASVLVDLFKRDFLNEWNKTKTIVDVYVNLVKNNWKTIEKFVGNNVLVNVGLKHWGWERIEDWIGTAVTVAVGLKKWGWQTLGQWTRADNGLTVNVALRHWGWSNIEDYIGRMVTVNVGLNRWGWSNITDFVGNLVNVAVDLYKGNFYSLNDWVGDWIGVEVYLRHGNFYNLADWIGREVTVRVNIAMGNGGVINVNANTNRSFGDVNGGGGGSSGGGAGRGRRATGGILPAGSRFWQNIPQFANGTLSALGSLFIAGERGPEVVGHIGGRTEVLNKSQIASAIFSAVRSAMAPASVNFALAASRMSAMSDLSNSGGFEAMMDYIQQSSEATNRQNELLRQQNEYLRSINDKDFNPEISTAAVTRAQSRMNRRAGTTIVPVGT